MSKLLQRICTVLLVAGFILAPLSAMPVSANPGDPPAPRSPDSPYSLSEYGSLPDRDLPPSSPIDSPLSKLSDGLQTAAVEGSTEDIQVTVIATGPVASAPDYMTDWSSRPVLEYTVYGGTVNAADLTSLAADPNVAFVKVYKPYDVPTDPTVGRNGETTVEPTADFESAQARLAEIYEARGLTAPAASTAPVSTNAPNDWWGGQDVHGGDAANAAGYTGDGVMVAMVDSGVDFGHPDLYGQQAVYPAGHTYEGWPIALDPTSMRNYYYNGYTFPDGGQNSWYADTSNYIDVTLDISDVVTTTVFYNVENMTTYTVTAEVAASSASGRLRYGAHPDYALSGLQGQFAGVLLVDSTTPYVYDTVYVDLNGDLYFNSDPDFDVTGDMVVNDVDVPATKASPILIWDDNWTTTEAFSLTATPAEPVYIDSWSGGMPRLGTQEITATTWVLTGTQIWQPDGKADMSGGMIYFIADGETPIPGSEMLGYGEEGIIPMNGSMVAFMLGTDSTAGGDHGTNCSTMVLATGTIDFPAFSGGSLANGQVQFPFADNTLQGLAPDAKLIAVGSVYPSINGMQGIFDAHDFIALGTDGIAGTGDEAQVANYSFGDDSVFDDGWDLESRYITNLTTNVNPNLAIAAATGNDGPGYGSIDSPASSAGVIAVGASTSYGSTQLANWGIPSADYINSGDLVYFSNRGPSSMGANPDIMAIGFVNHVAIPVNANTDYDGNTALSVGGGTSYATPFVAGALADVYQAYIEKWGEWPTAETAKAILMAGADDMSYDVFSQGAGNVRADTAAMIADGEGSTFTSPSTWDAGDYHGTEYKSFASIVPGESAAKTFTVYNTADTAETVAVSDEVYQLVETQVYTLTTNPTYESNFWASVGYGLWYGQPDYLLSVNPDLATTEVLTSVLGAYTETYTVHGSDLLLDVPDDAELLRAYVNQDWSDFDYGYMPDSGDYLQYYGRENWDLMLFQWDDLNENGRVWADWNDATTPDGVVNPWYWGEDMTDIGNYDAAGVSSPPIIGWFAADGEGELSLINRAIYPDAPGSFIEVANPNDRGAGTATDQGLVLGLQHTYSSGYPQVLTVTLEYYQAVDWAWLDVDMASLEVPAAGTEPGMATFEATVNVPTGTEPGVFEGAIIVDGSVVPVQVSVADEMEDNFYFTFGSAQEDTPYRNGEMFSANMWWGGGYGNGDWRFYNFDLLDTSLLSEDAVLWYANQWGDLTVEDLDPDPAVLDYAVTEISNMPGDINPYLFGPANDGYAGVDPTLFGPHGMANLYGGTWPDYDGNYLGLNGGDWYFDTSTSGPIDDACIYRPGGYQEGLHEFVLHTGIFGGNAPSMPFSGEVGFFSLLDVEANVTYDSGTVETTLISPWEETVVMAYGAQINESFINQQVAQGLEPGSEYPSDLFDGWVYEFTLDEDMENLYASTSEATGYPDLSLFLLYDANGDGIFNIYDTQELLAWHDAGNPYTNINLYDPAAGDYRLIVYGNYAEMNDYFHVYLNVYGGSFITVQEADEDGVVATVPGVPTTLHLEYEIPEGGVWYGWIETYPAAWDQFEPGDSPIPVDFMLGCYQDADVMITKGLTTMLETDVKVALGGQTVVYTATLENHTDTTFWPYLEIVLPDHTTYVPDSLKSSDAVFPAVSNAWYDTSDHIIYWGSGGKAIASVTLPINGGGYGLAPGSSVEISFELRVDQSALPGTELVATAYPWGFGETPVEATVIVAYPIFLPIVVK